jgi:hypothetical protein
MTEHPDLSHLDAHRSDILVHAVMVGVAGLVPVPVVDDYLSETARGRMIRRLVQARGLSVPPPAVRKLAAEKDAPGWRRVATATGLLAATRRRYRKLFFAVVFAERADHIADAFLLGTLLDHYLLLHHSDAMPELGAPQAAHLRAVIDRVASGARRDLTRGVMERAGRRLTRVAARVPELVASMLRTLRGHPEEPADPTASTRDTQDPVSAAAAAAAEELASSGSGVIEAVVTAFDAAWANGHAGEEAHDPR